MIMSMRRRRSEPQTFRLGSTSLISAAGIVRWAIAGYAHKRDQAAMVEVLTLGWDIPEAAATALLSKAVPYDVEDDETVVFMVP